MTITQTTVEQFTTGDGTADATPKPIMAAGYVRKAYKGVQVRCNTGTVYIGPRTLGTENGFEVPAGKEILIPVEDPATVYVVGDGTFSWLAV